MYVHTCIVWCLMQVTEAEPEDWLREQREEESSEGTHVHCSSYIRGVYAKSSVWQCWWRLLWSRKINTMPHTMQCCLLFMQKPNQNEPTCRFNYSFPEQACSTSSFERLSDSSTRDTLTTKRNNPRINSHNHLQLQHWRANVDFEIPKRGACSYYAHNLK